MSPASVYGVPAGLRLDYVSPLPPVRTGIADYSVDLLAALAELGALRADDAGPTESAVRVVRVEGQEVSDEVAERFAVVPWSELGESSVGVARVPVWQMGNNLHHEAIDRRARELPGIVTLHDVFLHHLLIERTLGRVDLEAYVAELEREHGWVGGVVALPPRWSVYAQSGMFALPAHRTLLEAQRGVLVHSEWARRKLEEEQVRVPVRVIPMPMPLPPLDDAIDRRAAELRRAWRVPEGAPLLGSFGFQTPIKRTDSAVRALAQPGMETAHLVIAGQEAPELELDALCAELQLHDRVHRTGFLPADDWSAAIRACDLCVNLRYPTAGETSASLLRILALGRPTVLSDYAQFADLRGDFAVHASLGDDPGDRSKRSLEVRSIAKVCGPLLRERENLLRRGEVARAFVREQHDPERCASLFLAACAELLALPERTTPTATVQVPRPTSLTWGELQSRIEVVGFEQAVAGRRSKLRISVHNDGFCRWLPASAGDGGLMLEVQVYDTAGQPCLDGPWPGLRREVGPGEIWFEEVELRWPLDASRLLIEPHVAGGASFSRSRGARWQGELRVDDDGRVICRETNRDSISAEPTACERISGEAS